MYTIYVLYLRRASAVYSCFFFLQTFVSPYLQSVKLNSEKKKKAAAPFDLVSVKEGEGAVAADVNSFFFYSFLFLLSFLA
jgi:hypothetical protein